jgi:hypothetical protein
MSSILFVTAFKDIQREKWSHYSMATNHYLYYFYNLANTIDYTLVVFVETHVHELIKNSGHIFRDNIVFHPLENVDTFYNRFLESDTKIINSKQYKMKIPEYRWNLPEHNYSEYNLINHSKINFIRHSRDMFPEYSFYAWIDFGRMNDNIDNIPKNLDLSRLRTDCITYQQIYSPPNPRKSEEEMLLDNAVYFLGSSFIVPTNMVTLYEDLWRQKLEYWKELGTTDDDQNLALQLYYDDPTLLYGIRDLEWFGLYRFLQ